MGRRKATMNEHEDQPATEQPGVSTEQDAPENEAPAEVKVVDKRRFARLLGLGGSSDANDEVESGAGDARLPSYVDELKRRVEAAESSSRTELEAAKARLERHFESQLVTARADMAAGLLDVLDNLDRAIGVPRADESRLYDGIVATRDQFIRKLTEMGVEPVPGVGAPFNPEDHQAIDEVEVSEPSLDGTVVEVLQRGFRTAERLVRPAFVRVGRWNESEKVPTVH